MLSKNSLHVRPSWVVSERCSAPPVPTTKALRGAVRPRHGDAHPLVVVVVAPDEELHVLVAAHQVVQPSGVGLVGVLTAGEARTVPHDQGRLPVVLLQRGLEPLALLGTRAPSRSRGRSRARSRPSSTSTGHRSRRRTRDTQPPRAVRYSWLPGTGSHIARNSPHDGLNSPRSSAIVRSGRRCPRRAGPARGRESGRAPAVSA